MADQKLTDLTALASPTDDDLLYVVDDPAGTPASHKATIAAVLALVQGLLPTGGSAGEILTKQSGTDFDAAWAAAASGGVIDDSRPNINVSNSTTETTVYTVTIPGGTLSTNKIVRVVLSGSFLKNGGGVEGMTFRFKYGGSTLVTMAKQTVTTDDANPRPIISEIWLYADGATNAQIMEVRMLALRDSGDAVLGQQFARVAAAIDSTADQTLEITEQMGSMTPLHQYTSEHAITTAP